MLENETQKLWENGENYFMAPDKKLPTFLQIDQMYQTYFCVTDSKP